MMMADDKKKLAMIIISKRLKPSDSKEKAAEKLPDQVKEVEGDEVDSEPGLSAAAEEMIQAFERKDASALKSALKDFISMCSYHDDKDDSDESGNV